MLMGSVFVYSEFNILNGINEMDQFINQKLRSEIKRCQNRFQSYCRLEGSQDS